MTSRHLGLRIFFAVAAAVALGGSRVSADGSPPVVRDALGETVGTYLGEATEVTSVYGASAPLVWVARPVPGTEVRLLVGEEGPWDTKSIEPLLYESEDCTGLPLLESPAKADEMRSAVIFGTDVFWPEQAGTGYVIRSAATLVRAASDCADTLVAAQVCCERLAKAETKLAAPVTGVSLASLRLSPPFRIDRDTATN
ncbi:MAG TPA: hypothetical protein VFD84_00545 [Candidatus Binatia bacterium]|nr:hypothetical protein [Candidatus Binatia bacterium]